MDHSRRLSVLVTSPRVCAGLLSGQAWQSIGAADKVFARDVDYAPSTVSALALSGVEVTTVSDTPTHQLAEQLVAAAQSGPVIWVGSSDADPGLSEALAQVLTTIEDPPDLEMLIASWDVPGARLLDAVTVVDRLRSPAGCPWSARQTHGSLIPYLVEEVYECVEALDSGDREHAAEELGDVLYQVLFHARVADEAMEGFDIDDVAGALVEKLIRRHPHVFAAVEGVETAEDVETRWAELKAIEKPERTSPLAGIPAGMPDLARASTVVARLTAAGHGDWLTDRASQAGAGGPEQALGGRLLEMVLAAQRDGLDPGAALRAMVRSVEQAAADLSQ